MKNTIFIAIISGILIIAAGCSSATTVESNRGAETADKKTTEKVTSTAPKSSESGATPTAAAEKMFVAIKDKDAAALKAMLSAESLKDMEESAKRANQPIEKYLADVIVNVPVGDKFEARNEKVEGDKATVEMPDNKGKWSPNKFVKENGVWKISLS